MADNYIRAKVDQFIGDVGIVHQVAHGDENTVVMTENGPVRSLAKLIKDNELQIGELGRSIIRTPNIQEETSVDEISTKEHALARWTVYLSGTLEAHKGKRLVMEIMAVHNGTPLQDADFVDNNGYAKLRTDPFTDVELGVDLTGEGHEQRMRLRVISPNFAVDAIVVRENTMAIDFISAG